MSNIAKVEDSATITTTEYDIVRDANYSSGSLTAGPACVVVELDVDALLITDTFTLRLRTDVNGDVASVTEWVLQGPYTDHIRIDFGLLADYAITLIRTGAADRSIGWKLITDSGSPTAAEVWAVLDAGGTAFGALVTAINAAVAALPTAAANASALLAATVEGTTTVARWMRGMWSFGLTKASGFNVSPVVLRDAADGKDRISIAHNSTGRTSVTIHDLD